MGNHPIKQSRGDWVRDKLWGQSGMNSSLTPSSFNERSRSFQNMRVMVQNNSLNMQKCLQHTNCAKLFTWNPVSPRKRADRIGNAGLPCLWLWVLSSSPGIGRRQGSPAGRRPPKLRYASRTKSCAFFELALSTKPKPLLDRTTLDVHVKLVQIPVWCGGGPRLAGADDSGGCGGSCCSCGPIPTLPKLSTKTWQWSFVSNNTVN